MGYFPNGTSGAMYEDEYCSKCLHFRDCAVMEAHLIHNYKECNNPDSILHMLIPRDENMVHNEKCRMFIQGQSTDDK